jgi:hypothetical protein
MGGSGRDDYATTPTVGASRTLDVNELTDAVEHPGAEGTIRWGAEDDPRSRIGVALLPEDGDADRATAVRLWYTVDPDGDDTDREYTVPLEYTECNFGGVRPWFRCPGAVDGVKCGERVGKLHCPPRGPQLYLCRECHNLGYASSRASGNDMDTALLRYKRAFAKADAEGRRPHPNNAPHLPDRPKGMHHDTFADLLEEVQDAREGWRDAMDERLEHIVGKYEALLRGDEPMA